MTAIRIADSVISRDVAGRFVVLDVARRAYFELDGTAAAIWRAIERLGHVDPVIDSCAATFAIEAVQAARDVREFVADAVASGLLEHASLEDAPDVHRSQAVEPGKEVPAVSVDRSGLRTEGDVEHLRRRFAERPFIQLKGLVAPALLSIVERAVHAGEFASRLHPGIGLEFCLESGAASAACQLVFNDPALLDVVARVAGCSTLGCFDGRVYRLEPQAGHYDSWHSDASDDRVVGLSVNLSRETFGGGILEIRRADSSEADYAVPSPGFGDAVLFRISPALRHRVTPVHGRPRTAYAGWFRASPNFAEMFAIALNDRCVSPDRLRSCYDPAAQ